MTQASDRRLFAERADTLLSVRSWAAHELRREGMSKRGIASAVSAGDLVPARRGRYLPSTAPPDVIRAARVGGRLTCVSALRLLGVFVLEPRGLHVQIAPNASRLGAPGEGASVVRHWAPPIGRRPPGAGCAAPLDLLAHAVACQPPRAAVATLDSALHWGLVSSAELSEVFSQLPRKHRVLRGLVDGRSESGPETLMRLLLRGLSRSLDVQVRIDGVGRVDLLVDGWLVIECDSEAHHAGLAAHRVDRSRDLALAALGFTTLPPMAADIMWRPDRVVAAVRGLLLARRAR